ncbi:MAG TPA: Pr6Pr family membrane protein [Chitinophagaceae bacterium]|jgi:hypothetical protein|nr:Pr6Pr family membrane protein [Chitinophagaceae bacterium]
MRKGSAKYNFTIILALITWFGLGSQFYLTLQTPAQTGYSVFKTVVNFFSYFTVLCNILVALTLTVSLTGPGSFFSRVTVQSAITVYIFIVGLVYNLVLRGVWKPQGLQLVTDNILHVAVPLLFVVYWVAFTPRRVLQWKDILPWLIFPGLYLVYSLIRGPIAEWYPYPFLDLSRFGWGKVLINSVFITLAFLVAGLGIIAFNRSGTKDR